MHGQIARSIFWHSSVSWAFLFKQMATTSTRTSGSFLCRFFRQNTTQNVANNLFVANWYWYLAHCIFPGRLVMFTKLHLYDFFVETLRRKGDGLLGLFWWKFFVKTLLHKLLSIPISSVFKDFKKFLLFLSTLANTCFYFALFSILNFLCNSSQKTP